VSFSISHGQGELLAQVRPGVTTPLLAFAAQALRIEITLILCVIDPTVVLSTVGQTNIALYHDDTGGSTFDQSTIIMSETRLQLLQENILFQAQHPGSGILLRSGGQIAVQTADADDVTFSIYGITETRAERVVGR
jgi:hypothetical protein